MIPKQEIHKKLLELQSHTQTNVKEYQQSKVLPVFNTGSILNSFQFHYDDKWLAHRYSVEDPEAAYGVLKVSNMPYKSKFKRRSQMEFSGNIERMIQADELVPFLLFVNNRFVSWDKIDILHDCSNDYLLVHGEQFNYHHIKKVDMLVVPFAITCITQESEYMFSRNYNATVEYINSTAFVDNGKLKIRLPRYDTDYKYKNIHISIGAWMYKQYILQNMGLLPSDRYAKLISVPVEKYQYNALGQRELAYSNTVNLFDRDSYDIPTYDSLIMKIEESRTLFSFNQNGELENDMEKASIFVMELDESNIEMEVVTSDKPVMNHASIFADTLLKENYIVFKNGLLCTDCDLQLGPANTCRIDVSKTTDYKIDGTKLETKNTEIHCKIFHSKEMSAIIDNSIYFRGREYLAEQSIAHLNGEDEEAYLDDCMEYLDFKYENNEILDKNIDDSLNKVISYDPRLLNSLFMDKSYIYSSCVTGKAFNESLDKPYHNNSKYGLKVPRSSYEHNETYVLVFINGILIDSYDEMKVFPDHFFFPVTTECKSSDTVEFLYFTNCNNNELPFTYSKSKGCHVFEEFIPGKDLKLFSIDVEDQLIYDLAAYDIQNIAFPVYEEKDGVIDVYDDTILDGRDLVAVSSRKFIYQRLYIDQKAYKIRLDKRFRYCDNQNQYVVFLNGRRIPDSYFLVTIPKISRPFDAIYLYLTKFANPTDRIEVFYLPQELNNLNLPVDEDALQYTLQFPLVGSRSSLMKNGYFDFDLSLSMPMNRETYLFFVNGKKIPKDWLLDINSTTLRVLKDTLATNDLVINRTTEETIDEVVRFLSDEKKQSKIDALTNQIIKDQFLGYEEMDKLENCYVHISNTEENFMKKNVGKIAIINEIVRDFWVTSGYDYQEKPFVYDYYTDEFKYQEENGIWISPALDALPYDNIEKYDLHHLYFYFMEDMPAYFEIGTVIEKPTFIWEYNDNYGTEEVTSQKFNEIELANKDREYTLTENITTDSTFTLVASDGYITCESTVEVKFANCIYYGLVDEDFMDGNASDILSNNPEELFKESNLGDYVMDLQYSVQPSVITDIVDYVIGNTNYFVVAIPKRLALDENGKDKIVFYLPDITTDEFKEHNWDDKTLPIYTNGKFNHENHFTKLEKFEMERFVGNFNGVFEHTNSKGYVEDYVLYKSTGYFTRLYDNTKFTIRIR